MELDEFKTLLKQHKEQPFDVDPIRETQGLDWLKTDSIVLKLKRNLRFELLVAIAFTLFICYTVFTAETTFVKLFSGLMFGFCTWFIIYVGGLYNRITHDHLSAVPVKESLRQLIRIMVRFTRVYFLLTLIMIPVIMLVAFVSTYLDQYTASGSSLPSFPVQSFLAFSALCLTWFVLMYFLTRWYLNKLYGGYLLSLQQKLQELEQDQ